MADAGNIGGDFKPRGKAYPRHFPEGRVRLFGGGGIHPSTNAAPLWTFFEGWGFGFLFRDGAFRADQLLDSWHGLQVLPRGGSYC